MNPYTLVIPDIHQRLRALDTPTFVKLADGAERIVCLGDYFDTHGGPDACYDDEVCDWLLTRPVQTDFLLGNHDCHYLFNHRNFRCSGYRGDFVKMKIQTALAPMLDQFRLHTWVGPYLLSHAGFHPWTLVSRDDLDRYETVDDLVRAVNLDGLNHTLDARCHVALECARRGDFHWLFTPGVDVGGQGYGGPTWMRWHRYVPIPGLPQIMGHTWQKDGQVKYVIGEGLGAKSMTHPAGLMLDTGLKHVAKIMHADWSVEVVRL